MPMRDFGFEENNLCIQLNIKSVFVETQALLIL